MALRAQTDIRTLSSTNEGSIAMKLKRTAADHWFSRCIRMRNEFKCKAVASSTKKIALGCTALTTLAVLRKAFGTISSMRLLIVMGAINGLAVVQITSCVIILTPTAKVPLS